MILDLIHCVVKDDDNSARLLEGIVTPLSEAIRAVMSGEVASIPIRVTQPQMMETYEVYRRIISAVEAILLEYPEVEICRNHTVWVERANGLVLVLQPGRPEIHVDLLL